MTELRDTAIRYSERGWRVFPVAARGKVPLTRHGCKDATSDRDQVWRWWTRWPRANIGVATGPGSGLFVVDLDGDTGLASWAAIEARYGSAITLEQATGGGGVHLLFAYPDRAELGNTAGRLGAAIDTRGQGGYILAAPSIHPSGRRYAWCEYGQADPAPCPAWLVALLVYRPSPLRPAVPVLAAGSRADRYWLKALDGELRKLAATPEGGKGRKGRNHALFLAARRLGELEHLGADHGRVAAALAEVAAAAGLGEREIDRTIASGWAAGTATPRWSR